MPRNTPYDEEDPNLKNLSAGTWASNIGGDAASGAAAGSTFGPWGTLAGGIVGAGVGAGQSAMQNDEYHKAQQQQIDLDHQLNNRSIYDGMIQQQGMRDSLAKDDSNMMINQAAARSGLTGESTIGLHQSALRDQGIQSGIERGSLYPAAQQMTLNRNEELLHQAQVEQDLANNNAPSNSVGQAWSGLTSAAALYGKTRAPDIPPDQAAPPVGTDQEWNAAISDPWGSHPGTPMPDRYGMGNVNGGAMRRGYPDASVPPAPSPLTGIPAQPPEHYLAQPEPFSAYPGAEDPLTGSTPAPVAQSPVQDAPRVGGNGTTARAAPVARPSVPTASVNGATGQPGALPGVGQIAQATGPALHEQTAQLAASGDQKALADALLATPKPKATVETRQAEREMSQIGKAFGTDMESKMIDAVPAEEEQTPQQKLQSDKAWDEERQNWISSGMDKVQAQHQAEADKAAGRSPTDTSFHPIDTPTKYINDARENFVNWFNGPSVHGAGSAPTPQSSNAQSWEQYKADQESQGRPVTIKDYQDYLVTIGAT